jgi:hypothetical protein
MIYLKEYIKLALPFMDFHNNETGLKRIEPYKVSMFLSQDQISLQSL